MSLAALLLATSCVFPSYQSTAEQTGGAGDGHAGGVSGGTAGGGAANSGAGGAALTQGGGGGSPTPAGGATSGAGSPSGGAADAQGGQGISDGGGGAAPEPQPGELARGHSATASSEQSGNGIALGNDGIDTTRWCASSSSLPQWWRVDLGSERLLTSFSVHWEHGDREYSYLVETSSDDKLFTTRISNSAIGSIQSADFPAGTQARYVRMTLSSALPAGWASFYELSLFGF